ncbi:GNAT family N-acetyltransferase [Aeromicrobium wangtongii]|uniref:GNAT family N-acetyltransferase n=1 Tax=Aeromicrobium wangtongii TaxID=2969247 RepID=A0ABY5MB69_9ACTN|nr:GNAT family protein [Aeromicrobium wangtongii]MCD9196735.1 GNAT family N-acetyltransferase [Aeromicrobium wangtongii]UUP14245.1 GNAT family N-acetyltransferase [Aeromicrobium wangtongii]
MPDFHHPAPLTSRLVRLEPLTPEHAEGVLAAADSDEVFRWLSFERPRDLAAARALVDRYLGDPALVAWAQIDTATGRVAGLTTFYDVDATLRTVAIGFTWLGSAHWRTGLNTESKLLLLTRAFDDLGCVRVVWHTDIFNQRSQAAIARLGAQREGVLRKHRIRRDGTWRDTVQFSMIDDEWPAARAALRARLDP